MQAFLPATTLPATTNGAGGSGRVPSVSVSLPIKVQRTIEKLLTLRKEGALGSHFSQKIGWDEVEVGNSHFLQYWKNNETRGKDPTIHKLLKVLAPEIAVTSSFNKQRIVQIFYRLSDAMIKLPRLYTQSASIERQFVLQCLDTMQDVLWQLEPTQASELQEGINRLRDFVPEPRPPSPPSSGVGC